MSMTMQTYLVTATGTVVYQVEVRDESEQTR